MKTDITKNMVDKIMPAKEEKRIKLADEDLEVEMDLQQELMETLKKQYKELKEEGYKGTFLDYIKNEIRFKSANGGLINIFKLNQRKP